MKEQGYSIILSRINCESYFYKHIKQNDSFNSEEKCGKINFTTYDDWYNSLSKHMKQNLRTAYNKISREEIVQELKIYDKNNWSKNTYKRQIDEIYERRWQTKNNAKFNFIKKILRRFSNPVNKLLNQYPERLLFILCLNGKVAAFCSCIYRDKKLYIPRLSIDSVNFKNYDVGSLLISEVLKYNNEKKLFNVIDLTRGGEPYKFKLGAIEHFNYQMQI